MGICLFTHSSVAHRHVSTSPLLRGVDEVDDDFSSLAVVFKPFGGGGGVNWPLHISWRHCSATSSLDQGSLAPSNNTTTSDPPLKPP